MAGKSNGSSVDDGQIPEIYFCVKRPWSRFYSKKSVSESELDEHSGLMKLTIVIMVAICSHYSLMIVPLPPYSLASII